MRIIILMVLLVITLSMLPMQAKANMSLVIVEDYRSDLAAEKLMARLDDYPDKTVTLAPLRLNYKFITSDSFHAYFRDLLSMKHSSPDIFFMDQIYLTDFVRSGFLADLTNYFPNSSRNAFVGFSINPAIIDKHLWALPIHSEVGVIYYRKDLLREAGRAIPKSWNEMRDTALAVMKRHPNIQGYIGQFKEYEGLVCNFAEFAWSNAVDPFSPEERDRTKLVEALQTLVDWVNKDMIIPQKSLEMTEGESIVEFAEGRALFLRHWPSGGVAWFKEALADDKIGLMALPPGPSGNQAFMVTGGWYFVVNAFSKNVKKAIEALTFLDDERSQMINFETKREIPSRKKLYLDDRIKRTFSSYYHYLEAGGFTARSRPQTPFYSELSKAIASSVHRALTKDLTVQEAVDRIYTEVQHIRKSANQ